jgi:hypothetical protein
MRAPRGLRPAKANGVNKSGALNWPPITADLYRHWLAEPIVPTPILVADLIPHEFAVLLAGRGGAGKGILMQTLATCVATRDKPFLGCATEHGCAVFFTTEDRMRALLHRQDRICRALGIAREDVADTLVLKSFRGGDCCMFRDGAPTPLMHIFEQWLKPLAGLRLAVIDSASLVYGDDENDRRAVMMFLRYLDLMAERLGCTIIIITHTSRTSDGTVERMTSGSTAWVNQSRASLLLSVGQDKQVSLTLKKTNEMKPDFTVDLEWTDDGVLVLPEHSDWIDEKSRERKLLNLIATRWSEGNPVSSRPQAKEHYLPNVAAAMGIMKAGHAEKIMLRLVQTAIVKVAMSDSHAKRQGLKPAEE